MKEIWRDIPNYEGYYQASTYGNVRNIKTGIILKPYINKKNGYAYINLSKNGLSKTIRMHRIIALTFVKNKLNKPCINHKDGNKENNCVSNLEWCTQKENVNHAIKVLKRNYANGINIMHEKNQKKVIRSDGKIYNSIKEAKQDIGNINAHIVEVCQGKLKTTCGYGWQYLKEGC
jgi:hypothetical protein